MLQVSAMVLKELCIEIVQYRNTQEIIKVVVIGSHDQSI